MSTHNIGFYVRISKNYLFSNYHPIHTLCVPLSLGKSVIGAAVCQDFEKRTQEHF